jgi:hypothetical protein
MSPDADQNVALVKARPMSMEHKAFAFHWVAFERELLPSLLRALEENETESLATFIDANMSQLVHPSEETPLDENWRSLLDHGDIQELGDLAITKYYKPADDFGLGAKWITIEGVLPKGARDALLGRPLGRFTATRSRQDASPALRNGRRHSIWRS